MLAWATAMLLVVLLALGWAAVHPAGAVLECRQAIEAARTIPISGMRR